jgi:hypothetical protein
MPPLFLTASLLYFFAAQLGVGLGLSGSLGFGSADAKVAFERLGGLIVFLFGHHPDYEDDGERSHRVAVFRLTLLKSNRSMWGDIQLAGNQAIKNRVGCFIFRSKPLIYSGF